MVSPFLPNIQVKRGTVTDNMNKSRSLVEEERQRLKWEEDEWEIEEFGKFQIDEDSEPDESYDSLSKVN